MRYTFSLETLASRNLIVPHPFKNRYKQTGVLHPHPQGKSPEPKLKREQLIDLVEILETNNDATLEELPYSPEFSPIENFWSKVKSILRQAAARTYKDLIDGIANAILKVTQENIRNWFAHCCYCTS